MAVTKGTLLKKAIDHIKKTKANTIKADTAGYTKPDKIKVTGFNKSLFPDAEAHYDKRVDLYCVEPKMIKNDLPDSIGRWIFMSIEARKFGGNLYIVIPEGHKDKYQAILTQKSISAEVMPVKV